MQVWKLNPGKQEALVILLFEEKEINLIEMFRSHKENNFALIPENETVENILESLLSPERWQNWVDSSGKDEPPPDFYNDHEKLMMEVMRVDDHGFKKKGKIINPTQQRAHEMEKELIKSGILDNLPSNLKIMMNPDTKLPSEEDHNIRYYYENFRRTVEHHKVRIGNYKENHPGFKVIFFVFDESSAYIECAEVPKSRKAGQEVMGRPHFWYRDKRFLDSFQNVGIDYLIWYAPYKRFENRLRINELMAAIYDCNNISFQVIEYDQSKLMSAEV